LFSPALALELSGSEKPVQQEVKIRQSVDHAVQVSFEEDVIIINGNGNHLTNGVKEPAAVNGINEQVIIDVVKEQIVIDENIQVAIENKEEVGFSYPFLTSKISGNLHAERAERSARKWNSKIAKRQISVRIPIQHAS
jgi:hypothetical protein